MTLKRALPHTGTAGPIAPLPATVVELEAADEAVDAPAALEVAEVEEAAVDLAAAAAPEVAPEVDPAVLPIGAVDWPLISAWTDALKLPVMLAIVNKAENDIWLKVVLVSTRVRDSIRTKYSLALGPMVAFGVNWIEDVEETSTEAMTVCSGVC